MFILLAEDSSTTSMVMSALLQKNSHRCISVIDGKEALLCLEATPTIDMVITDVEMPGMDGFGLLKEMRSRCEFEEIPVIISTSHADAQTVEHAKNLGCQHYILKPPSEKQLLQRIAAATRKQGLILEAKEVIIRRSGLTSENYGEILSTFSKEVEELLKCMDRDMETENQENILSSLRTLRDSVSLLGAERLANQLSKLMKGEGETLWSSVVERHKAFLRELKVLQQTLQEIEPSAHQQSSLFQDMK